MPLSPYKVETIITFHTTLLKQYKIVQQYISIRRQQTPDSKTGPYVQISKFNFYNIPIYPSKSLGRNLYLFIYLQLLEGCLLTIVFGIMTNNTIILIHQNTPAV